jgi:Uma2 family endonuclease
MATTLQEPPVRDDELYEVINGIRVRRPPMAILSVWIASVLHAKLSSFALARDCGWALCEALFHLPKPLNRDRRPDVAFVSYQRWPKARALPRGGNAWNVVPNLAIEVVSPNDTAEELRDKIGDYFQAGVESVWVVYPLSEEVYVYRWSRSTY